jgi:hypothetical protein
MINSNSIVVKLHDSTWLTIKLKSYTVYILMQILIFFKSKILSLKHVPIDFNPTVTDMLIT